jgi:hypothetical protein
MTTTTEASEPTQPVADDVWRENMQNAWAALRMIREAVETFGPATSLDGEDAVLLRGPEPVHEAEAIVEAIMRLATPPPSTSDIGGALTAKNRAERLFKEVSDALGGPGSLNSQVYSAIYRALASSPSPDQVRKDTLEEAEAIALAIDSGRGNEKEIARAIRALKDHPTKPGGGDALEDVLAERERQKSVEGWTPEHDDKHSKGELASAAACYATQMREGPLSKGQLFFLELRWPWSLKWWKPSNYRRNLVKAGALILAEIERLDRTTKPGGGV